VEDDNKDDDDENEEEEEEFIGAAEESDIRASAGKSIDGCKDVLRAGTSWSGCLYLPERDAADDASEGSLMNEELWSARSLSSIRPLLPPEREG
jgi:hypothetical protein